MEKIRPKYYITTAIAYTSGKPHIGNTYEIVLADREYICMCEFTENTPENYSGFAG